MSTEDVLRLKTLCLAHSEVKLPRADEHAALLFNGLGKDFRFMATISRTEIVHRNEAIVYTSKVYHRNNQLGTYERPLKLHFLLHLTEHRK